MVEGEEIWRRTGEEGGWGGGVESEGGGGEY